MHFGFNKENLFFGASVEKNINKYEERMSFNFLKT